MTLKVDYDLLHDSEQTLAYLKSEFDGLKGRTSDLRSALGNDDLYSAMEEFSGNMDYNRGKLTEEMKTVGEKFGGVIEAFTEADRELAEELRKAAEKSNDAMPKEQQ